MFQLEQLLVPVDFSVYSLIAVKRAGELARHFRSEITLFHVGGFTENRPADLNEFASAELEGVGVKRIFCNGDPAEQVLERSREQRPDLILMATHGYGAFRQLFLGSVTASVLQNAHCPVWTGAHLSQPGDGRARMGRVMCAVNFGPQSRNALRWAAGFAASMGAQLSVIYAVPDRPPDLPDRYLSRWDEDAQCGADEQIKNLLKGLGVHADILLMNGEDVPAEVSASAKEKDIDLVVIGRDREADRDAGAFGTLAYSIVCRSPCEVVSI
jgi:nucleotide-binding universal stress UspA family protein